MELILNRKRGRPRKPIQESEYSHGDSGEEYSNGNRKKVTMSEDARERHR